MAQNAYNIKSCKKWWLAARPSASSFPEQSRSLCPPGKSSSLQRITFPEQARSAGKLNKLCLNVFRSIPVHRSSTIGVYLCVFEQRHKGDMAGKITSMSKIKQVLIMHTQGMSNRDIAEETGLNKCTVNEYMRKARLDPLGALQSVICH